MFVSKLTDTTTGTQYTEMDQDTIWNIIRIALGFRPKSDLEQME